MEIQREKVIKIFKRIVLGTRRSANAIASQFLFTIFDICVLEGVQKTIEKFKGI